MAFRHFATRGTSVSDMSSDEFRVQVLETAHAVLDAARDQNMLAAFGAGAKLVTLATEFFGKDEIERLKAKWHAVVDDPDTERWAKGVIASMRP